MSVFRKICVLCFFETPALRFVLLLYYRRIERVLAKPLLDVRDVHVNSFFHRAAYCEVTLSVEYFALRL